MKSLFQSFVSGLAYYENSRQQNHEMCIARTTQDWKNWREGSLTAVAIKNGFRYLVVSSLPPHHITPHYHNLSLRKD